MCIVLEWAGVGFVVGSYSILSSHCVYALFVTEGINPGTHNRFFFLFFRQLLQNRESPTVHILLSICILMQVPLWPMIKLLLKTSRHLSSGDMQTHRTSTYIYYLAIINYFQHAIN